MMFATKFQKLIYNNCNASKQLNFESHNSEFQKFPINIMEF